MDIIRFSLNVSVISVVNYFVFSIYPQCQKDGKMIVYIQNFLGSGVLKENFGFCSNKDAIILIFQKCKVEQYVIKKNDLDLYYPNVKTIVWECEGKCLIEDTVVIANIIRCQKGNFNINQYYL